MAVISGEQSFQLVTGPSSVHIPWSAVREAVVLKWDCYTVDAIGMLVHCDEPFGLLQVGEQTAGFQEFADGMATALTGCLPFAEWYVSVAFPAFATNARCIYRRGGQPDPPLEPAPKSPAMV